MPGAQAWLSDPVRPAFFGRFCLFPCAACRGEANEARNDDDAWWPHWCTSHQRGRDHSNHSDDSRSCEML